VIIPAYNAEKFICECISSILSQHVKAQIVVVDDFSSDKTAKLVEKYSTVHLIKNTKNMGTYYSINVALKKFSSDLSWTHFLIHGADDVSLPNRFSKQMNGFSAKTLAVGCGFNRVNYTSKKIISTNMKTNESVLIFSRKIFDSIGYYNSFRVGGDTEYKKRLLLCHPNSIFQINEVLIKSYFHGNNLTRTIPLGGEIRKGYVRNFTKAHQLMKKNNNFYQPFIQ
jgi:glycosyltransferase involved in cell wall biosynthesis